MPCLQVSIRRIRDIPNSDISILTPRLQVGVTRKSPPLIVDAQDMGSHLKVTCGIICSINNYDYIVRFEKTTLVWNEIDNKVGVVKYNTLVASGSWSLEEVEIEELL